jgi:hypothetical protein
MFKLVEECELVRFMVVPGSQKEYDCPACGSPINYFSMSPYICSYCFSELPDIDALVTKVNLRAVWHVKGLSGGYENIDNVVFQERS